MTTRWRRWAPYGALAANLDVAPTFCALAGLAPHERMQGAGLLPPLRDKRPPDWRRSLYYRYFEPLDGCHRVQRQGVRTRTHELIRYPGQGSGRVGASPERRPPHWEPFDLATDSDEVRSRHGDAACAPVVEELTEELAALRLRYGDTAEPGSDGAGQGHTAQYGAAHEREEAGGAGT